MMLVCDVGVRVCVCLRYSVLPTRLLVYLANICSQTSVTVLDCSSYA